MYQTETTKYPDVEVQLVGDDGNAFAIMARVQRALRQHGVPKQAIDEYLNESTSGDYDHLLYTTSQWVTVM